MEIRAALQNEISWCVELNNRVLLENLPDSNSGFLLSKLSDGQLAEFNRQGILRVALVDNQLAGFILAFKRDSEFFSSLFPLIGSVQWSDATISSRQKLIYVYKKAVDSAFRRQGVATTLYLSLFEEFPDFGFLGATVEKPVCNQPSRIIRDRLQFRRVGTFQAKEFEGLRDYQSGIYFKSGV